MDTASKHLPVMIDRCVELLTPALDRKGAVAIDGTLGLGGHTEALLRTLPEVTVIGIDRDEEALAMAAARLKPFGTRFVAHHSEFDDIENALARVGATRADGILLDLGVSSLQIDEVERGFSYSQDAPLDMRMDRSCSRTAADILRDEPEEEIARILKEYGEERFAKRIARGIARRREASPITRSGELVDLIRASIPAAARTEGGNPAKRTFQALRIAVNDELVLLGETLPRAIARLSVGGRIVVLSYHSLEDRLVKHALVKGAEVRAPRGMPVVRKEDRPFLRLLVKGAEKASEAEARANPRSRSVRLRAAERIREGEGWAA